MSSKDFIHLKTDNGTALYDLFKTKLARFFFLFFIFFLVYYKIVSTCTLPYIVLWRDRSANQMNATFYADDYKRLIA